MDEIIKIDTIERYNKLYGLETMHPLVGVVDLTNYGYAGKREIAIVEMYYLCLENKLYK